MQRVLLSSHELETEMLRALAIAKDLPPGRQGRLNLRPYLHFKQCWEIIERLRDAGFRVRADGSRDRNGFTSFHVGPDGSVGVSFLHGYTALNRYTQKPAAVQKPRAPEPGLLEKLSLDKAMERKALHLVKKKPPEDSRNADNRQRVLQILSSLRLRPTVFADFEAPAPVPRRFRRGKAGSRKESKSKRKARQHNELDDK